MLAKMKKTQAGSTNGIKIINYQAGQEYDLPEDLYDVFVNQMKIAEPVAVQEEKMVTPPENKAEKPEKDKKKGKKDKKDDDEEDPFDASEAF